MNDKVLILNNLVNVTGQGHKIAKDQQIATIIQNFVYFGYVLSTEVIGILYTYNENQLADFNKKYTDILKEISGDSRNISKFVVYQNFPKEVLNMSNSEYWFNQIWMYFGAPAAWFRQTPKDRPKLNEALNNIKVLHVASQDKYVNILTALCSSPSKWNDNQKYCIDSFVVEGLLKKLDLISFKENMVYVAVCLFNLNIDFDLKSPTDILRFVAGYYGQDVALKEKVRFGRAPNRFRKFVSNKLNLCHSDKLKEDFAARPEIWKRLLFKIRPADHGCENVFKIYKLLNDKQLRSVNSYVEAGDLDTLSSRPGVFFRRINALHGKKIDGLYSSFKNILPQLTSLQLVKLWAYLNNPVEQRLITPNSNWGKAQVVEPNDLIPDNVKGKYSKAISEILATRIKSHFGEVYYDESIRNLFVQLGNVSAASYGRGTRFKIEDNITFIRLVSYWQAQGINWADVGINFLDENFNQVGYANWISSYFNGKNKFAVFSGDPVNTAEMKGRACQMIDIYLNELPKNVAYGVYNILSFCNKQFADMDDVFAAIQLGEKPTEGKLFEPSRCKFATKINDKAITKFVFLIDFINREIILLDANLKCSTRSCGHAEQMLHEKLPALIQKINASPNYYDIFRHVKSNKNGKKILFSDANHVIKGEEAFVFMKENPDNIIKDININEFLSK